uniref:Uncharacterized protein n=1 Tax=Tanacetum cinerariifolium TaxID=118510 RepID=A0A699HKT8_TANCI|nr:hypothetical protein [Tanacetum cinerariifolium]
MELDFHLHQSGTKWHVLVVDFLSNRSRRIANNILQWVIFCQLIDEGEPAGSIALGAATASRTGEIARGGGLKYSSNNGKNTVSQSFFVGERLGVGEGCCGTSPELIYAGVGFTVNLGCAIGEHLSSRYPPKTNSLEDSTRRFPPKTRSRSVWSLMHGGRLIGRKPISFRDPSFTFVYIRYPFCGFDVVSRLRRLNLSMRIHLF